VKIDNVTVTDDGTATTRVNGYTFTHGEKCKIASAFEDSWGKEWPEADSWRTACDCYLSRIQVTAVNGVTLPEYRRPWWKPRWSLASFAAGVVLSSLWDWLVPYA
jgi:hypothetical protein